jgi:hypothetical protein
MNHGKHTPGPWAYQEQSDAYTHIVRGPDNLFICQLSQTTSSEIEANTRLIAAAPELLQALQLVECVYRKNCVNEGEPSSVLDSMQAAIAKATGARA